MHFLQSDIIYQTIEFPSFTNEYYYIDNFPVSVC